MGNEWIENLRSISIQAVEAGRPADVCQGTVTSARPLMVQLDQKTTLNASQLLVPQHLTDHAVQMVLPELGEAAVAVKSGLKVGDKVLMIQKKGAQQYLVVGRY